MSKFSIECMSDLLHHECRYGACECICHKKKGASPAPVVKPIPPSEDDAQVNVPRPPNCF
jgi:hypothetical protein